MSQIPIGRLMKTEGCEQSPKYQQVTDDADGRAQSPAPLPIAGWCWRRWLSSKPMRFRAMAYLGNDLEGRPTFRRVLSWQISAGRDVFLLRCGGRLRCRLRCTDLRLDQWSNWKGFHPCQFLGSALINSFWFVQTFFGRFKNAFLAVLAPFFWFFVVSGSCTGDSKYLGNLHLGWSTETTISIKGLRPLTRWRFYTWEAQWHQNDSQ